MMERRESRSRGYRFVLMVVIAAVLGLMLAGTAWAATPQEIYDDFAADGKLDGDYTQAELEAVLTDPVLAQYGDPEILDKFKTEILTSRDAFPFTGAQMAMILGGGLLLVVLGVFLRRGRRGEVE